MKRGIYETIYGNAAFVAGPSAKSAWDLDAGEKIPLEMMEEGKFIRKAEKEDRKEVNVLRYW